MSFIAEKHGFHFSNFDIEWQLELPDAGYYKTTQLCGGMVYAALDYFHAGIAIPGDTAPPAIGTPLHNYILDRQVSAHKTLLKFLSTSFTIDGYLLMRLFTSSEFDSLATRLAAGPQPLCLTKLAGGHHVLALGMQRSGKGAEIKIWDPGYPDVTCTLKGDSSGFTNTRSNSSWTGLFVDNGYSAKAPGTGLSSVVAADDGFEEDWRWCGKCMSLFWEGDTTNGFCAGSGWHRPQGKKNYRLGRKPDPLGESNWKWCKNCQMLFWAGGPDMGVCPGTGKGHDSSNGTVYTLRHSSSGPEDSENGWRYCRACRGLYYSTPTGVCPAKKDGHDTGSPYDYFLAYTKHKVR